MHTMKKHSRNSGVAPPNLNRCPRWRCAGGHHHPPDALPTGKTSKVPSE